MSSAMARSRSRLAEFLDIEARPCPQQKRLHFTVKAEQAQWKRRWAYGVFRITVVQQVRVERRFSAALELTHIFQGFSPLQNSGLKPSLRRDSLNAGLKARSTQSRLH